MMSKEIVVEWLGNLYVRRVSCWSLLKDSYQPSEPKTAPKLNSYLRRFDEAAPIPRALLLLSLIWALAPSPDGKTITCGRDDRSVSGGIRMGRCGGHIASGSDDGTILIRKAESGEIEVGPIKTGQSWVYSLA